VREPETIWNEIRDELRRETPDFKFHIWLGPLELAGVEGRTLYVRAPEHIRSWVTERYLPLLREVASRRFDERAIVEVVGEGWSAPSSGQGGRASGELAAPPPAGARLNPKYTFEQFVIGGGNRFAHAAALAVAELPAQAYNPLFLHGAPGVGKTHLLHAVGNYVCRYGGGLRVRYATVERFTSEFVAAVREHKTAAFKEAFRQADVVLIDDVQFLARKERTREEFFHTFNALVESGSQLVLTSDHPPDELSGLEARLSERFQSGLVVEVEAPSVAVRRAILAQRARSDGFEAEPAVIEELARRVTSSVRALEGALIRVIAYASLQGETPSPALVRHVLRRLGEGDASVRCSLTEIVDAAAQEFGVRSEELLARSRRAEVATARHVAMYLARELTDHSLPEIGRGIGQRNHTTVLHALNRINAALSSDRAVRDSVDNVRRQLGARA
jgi:chromosomal replication initiator protein